MSNLDTYLLQVLKTCVTHLTQAEKPIRILRTLGWSPAVKVEFLRQKGQKLPVVDYPKFEARESLAHIKAAREALKPALSEYGENHPVTDWVIRTANGLENAALMLSHIGTAEFYTYSKALYGDPTALLLDGKTRVIDLAEHMDKTLADLELDDLDLGEKDVNLSASAFAKALSEALEPHFGEQAPVVKVSAELSAKAAAGAKRIRVRAGAQFTYRDVNQLLQHEALIHAATALNGRAQNRFKILRSAHAGTTETQEGLAVFAEIISGAMDPTRFRRLAHRVIAINMAIEGADFIKVFNYFKSLNQTDDQAYENTRRVFRGGVLKGGAPFTKDLVYLNGLLRVHNFLRSTVSMGRADLIRILFAGKMDINDVPLIALLASEKQIVAPKFLPPWVKDLRFLVSYLAYSSFLNRVKLPGFRAYYTERLSDIPKVWDFAQTEG